MRILLAILMAAPAWAQHATPSAAASGTAAVASVAQTAPADDAVVQASGASSSQTPPAGQTPPAAPQSQTPPAAPAAPAATEQKAESPKPSSEDWLTGSLDVGYRWVSDIGGNFAEYRSVVDLANGPRLFGLVPGGAGA